MSSDPTPEDLTEQARVRALRLMAEALLGASREPALPASVRGNLADAALDVLLELREGPVGAERHGQLQEALAEVAISELGEPFDR